MSGILFLMISASDVLSWHALPGAAALKISEWTVGFDLRMSRISVKEYVLVDAPDGSEYTLSRLDWELDRVWTGGISLTHRMHRHGYLSFGVWLNLPISSGTMDDYDWANETRFDDLLYDGLWTHYSHQKNKLNYLFSLDVNYHFTTGFLFRFYCGGGLALRAFKMDAYDGYTQYPENPVTTSPLQVTPTDTEGTGITYSLVTVAPYASLGFIWHPARSLDLSLFVIGSPVARVIAVDNHLFREVEFRDTLDWGLYLFTALRIGVALSSAVRLQLQLEGLLQPKTKGDATSKDTSTGVTYILGQSGAASTSSLSFVLRVEFRI